MLRMFRLIFPAFILSLFFAKSIANPIDRAVPVPDHRDRTFVPGPIGMLEGLPLLAAEPHGAGSEDLGAAGRCWRGYHSCPYGGCCPYGYYCHGRYCLPNGSTPCGTGNYCWKGFYCYNNIACFPKGATPCGDGNHFCWPGSRCCNHRKSCCY
ncbi:uncharacterized protein EI90DRAFT_3159704 [Cantharellus anzutake]|uniref:uncharacterized protein n=1 Tax=Cantharellus anzutake TaxID=1750568 RepID=UPI001904CC96|nr:uncharacterized protein EI90DRAFT_3159704 [Cantharellus anzutake]KAF8313363.1 hypothetical protein EI90DRAFT_3159704 [Cantharellus anzutake]